MNKKLIYISAAVTGLIFSVFLVVAISAGAYDAYEKGGGIGGGPHRKINELSFNKFIETVAKNDPILSKYDFDPSSKGYDIKQLYTGGKSGSDIFKVKGMAVTAKGDWEKNIKQEEKSGTIGWWIIEGGFSADEPERYMSLRHFYNPVKEKGEPYLTDLPSGSSLVMGENPMMDARTWATVAGDNPYSWINGLRNLKDAMLKGDQGSSAKYAASWRSFGESMHLIADMTVPAHVRNDAHSGSGTLWDKSLRADPYEYFTDAEVVQMSYDSGLIKPEMINQISECKNPQALFDIVASYTNKNFFSSDTLWGTDPHTSKPVSNSNHGPVFDSPRLDACSYENGDYIVEDFPGQKLTVAHESWLNASGWSDRAPTITYDAALSQAKRLIPVAVEANTKLIDLFMPRVQIGLPYDYFDYQNYIIHGNYAVLSIGGSGQYDTPNPEFMNCTSDIIIRIRLEWDNGSQKVYYYMAPEVKITDGNFQIPISSINDENVNRFFNFDQTRHEPITYSAYVSLGTNIGGILVWSDEYAFMDNYQVIEQPGTDENYGDGK